MLQLSISSLLVLITLVSAQRTNLDNFNGIYRNIRLGLLRFLQQGDAAEALRFNMARGKVQKQFPPDQPFFCDPNGPGRRSDTVPTSVHKLRPGDIDIIGAMGDSLTAGNGALATNIIEVLREYKGVSGAIGGQGTWRQFLTVPNILKEFNPKLYGYSTEESITFLRSSKFNAAEITARSSDMPYMANVLVKRIKSDPKVDLQNHWKAITLMVGPNDFCSDICYQPVPEKVLDYHDKYLTKVLRTLRDNLPRTIVSIYAAPSMEILLDFVGTPYECVSAQRVECPCMFGGQFESQRKRYLKIMKQWNEVQHEVANREEFHNKTDFTVTYLPWSENVRIPLNKHNQTDFTYLSADCFHLSQKGYARATNAGWNNLFELEGEKTANWSEEFSVFKCPTEERPYFATKENSMPSYKRTDDE